MNTPNTLRVSKTVDLHYVDSHTAQVTRLPALLLLHGTTGEGKNFEHVFADLDELAREYRLIIPDLRGHGRTMLPPDEWPFTHRQCAEDMKRLLDHLEIERASAIGISLGANTLLHLSSSSGERIEAMVLVAATPYFPEQARAIMRESPIENQLFQKQVREGFAEDVDDLAFTPARLARIKARTLLVNGDRDPLYPVSMLFDMRRDIPRSSLWVIPEGGHAPIFGEQREMFERTARRFLKGEPL